MLVALNGRPVLSCRHLARMLARSASDATHRNADDVSARGESMAGTASGGSSNSGRSSSSLSFRDDLANMLRFQFADGHVVVLDAAAAASTTLRAAQQLQHTARHGASMSQQQLEADILQWTDAHGFKDTPGW